MSDASDLIKDFQNLAESADETELSVLSRIVSGLKAKRGQRKHSYLSSLLQLNKDVSNQGTTPTMT
ncbi:hypothetical protein Q8G35_05410 [Peribacillus simplex]|uniref:Uncharacterized protein n=2 Tax=Peribacillus TaxID=2675229 RepID=A0AA90P873_9BACI|nr:MULTISPECIES: hypothetical protein [Peribacillus]MDP1417841.1 hypothetical protein [Peribacillus simplex]MDP1450693.1 hypothetical protein [Peribacillus frigoritolerans]